MPHYHFVVSAFLAVVVFHFTKSLQASLLCFIAGFAIDVDHVIDFWLYRRKITIDKEIFQHFHGRFGKIYVFLHSIELLVPIVLLGSMNSHAMVLSAALALGFISHLLLDFLSYDLHPLSYFLTYRILKKFDIKYICSG